MTFEYPQKLRFKCVKCGICCGDTPQKTRHVLLLREEAKNIAEATKKEISDFASEVVNKAPYSFEIRKTSGSGRCVFLKRDRCAIYSERPLICRFYPIGLEVGKNKGKVFYFTEECPGIGRGRMMRQVDFKRLLDEADRLIIEESFESSDDPSTT